MIQRTYEDHVAGKLTDKRFLKLSQQYEAEQEQLESELKRLAAEMETVQEQTGRVDKFMALVDRYTSFASLGEYLSQQTEDSVTLSFSDVERVIGKPLCKSAFKFYS